MEGFEMGKGSYQIVAEPLETPAPPTEVGTNVKLGPKRNLRTPPPMSSWDQNGIPNF